MTTEEFIEKFVKIEFVESSNSYGLYPFQLLATKDGKNELNALMVNRVQDVINRVKEYLSNGYEVFVAVDFPAGEDVVNDFVLCLHVTKDGVMSSSAVIEYSPSDGYVIETSNIERYELAKKVANYFVLKGV